MTYDIRAKVEVARRRRLKKYSFVAILIILLSEFEYVTFYRGVHSLLLSAQGGQIIEKIRQTANRNSVARCTSHECTRDTKEESRQARRRRSKKKERVLFLLKAIAFDKGSYMEDQRANL